MYMNKRYKNKTYGGHIDMRPVSLEPVWPGGVPSGERFFENLPVAELPKK
jgi:hypothetical protein